MSEYWLISAPGDKTCQQTYDTMNNITSKQNNLCENCKFHIPDLKVGTLDQLVGLSDDLGKLDQFVDQITRKVAHYLGEVLEDQRDKLHENLMANNNPGSPIVNNQVESPTLPNGQESCYPPLPRSLSNSFSSDINTSYACSPIDECSDSFDWWFYNHRGSNKSSRSRSSSQTNMAGGVNCTHKSSPMSSCCGSSHGRSSPDELTGDGVGEPPPMPLSPAELSSYITRFQWDMAKYPIKQSLRNIADIISKQVSQIEVDLKTKSNSYNSLKGTLQNLEKKQTGSLTTRSLVDLVKKEHFILDSEYLTTLLVVVPKNMANDWINEYEKLTAMIVPRSSTLIFQDVEHMLFNVTLFKKVVEEFKLHAREKKFFVRDFVYNEEELAAGKNEITKLATDKKKQFGPLVRWLKVNFSECFCAWIHVKALRVFVESVLRYGLPVNFQAILIHPNKKSTKRLRDVLNQLYNHLDGSASSAGSNVDQNMDMMNLGFGQTEYYPYVYYKINIDMIDSKA